MRVTVESIDLESTVELQKTWAISDGSGDVGISCMVRQLDRVNGIDVDAETLKAKRGAAIADVSMYHVRLNGKHVGNHGSRLGLKTICTTTGSDYRTMPGVLRMALRCPGAIYGGSRKVAWTGRPVATALTRRRSAATTRGRCLEIRAEMAGQYHESFEDISKVRRHLSHQETNEWRRSI